MSTGSGTIAAEPAPLGLDAPGTTSVAVDPGPVAAASDVDTEAPTWLARLTPALSILCWFYLSVIAFLFAWVVIVWAAVGWTPNVVTTGSMQPAINPGDIVLAAPPEADVRLDAGTVITFEDPVRAGELITHRIDTVNPDGTYVTRGDANSSADSYEVGNDDLSGVGRLLVPAVGLPRVWLSQGNLGLLLGWSVATLLSIWGALHRPRRAEE